MSNEGLIIEEKSRDIGAFLVGRYLPFRKKRMVGPFIFIDHMGPVEFSEGQYFDIDNHPHIGLSTLTYLFEGEAIHRDSMGTEQRIKPGSVNWMTAGKGVVHTERTPEDLRGSSNKMRMHGFQIWVALPKEREQMPPQFHHVDKEDLPRWQEDDISFCLVAGKAFGKKSPVPVHSDLFMIELKNSRGTAFNSLSELKGEIGVIVVDGAVKSEQHTIEKGNMLVSKMNSVCELKLLPNSHLMIFGGQPFPEKRFIDWNFVSSDREVIRQARDDWENRRFKMVPNDNSYIPLPNIK